MVDTSLQVNGLVSGLDTTSIIQKMMAAEQAPLTVLQNQRDETQKKEDAINDLRTRLTSLLSAVQNLELKSTIETKTVTTDTPSSSPTLVTATANADAALGSFTVRVQSLATATSVTSGTGPSSPTSVGKAVASGVPLASAGFGITPTTGTFTINGATITIDANTVLTNGVDADTDNTIVAKIRVATAAAGQTVTASLVPDADGRLNKLQLTSTGPMLLGSSSDTSNFLTAANLSNAPVLSSGGSYTATSTMNLGRLDLTALVGSSSANLDVPITTPTGTTQGTFSINGVQINYDTAKDTLNDVISRINTSAANVTATYDSVNDRISLTANNTGTVPINLQDVSGNFLAAMKLAQSNEVFGTNASYYLNDGANPRYSSSNTVTDAVSGVTINLKKADPNTDVTLTVGEDTTSAVNAVQDFVNQYNSTVGFIRDNTAYDASTKTASLLMGDFGVENIENTMAVLVGGTGVGLGSVATNFADVGISTGPVGTAVGQTDKLVLDTAKLTAALQSNPDAVADLFGGLASNVSLDPGGTGSIASLTGLPSNHVSGAYSIVSDGLGGLTATFTPSGGGVSSVTTGTITAGGMNSTLIPGLSLTAKSTLAAGTDSITASFTKVGVGVKLDDFLSSLTAVGGALDAMQQSDAADIQDMNDSMQRLQDQLNQKQQDLTTQFNNLETSLATLQSQSAALSAQIAKLG